MARVAKERQVIAWPESRYASRGRPMRDAPILAYASVVRVVLGHRGALQTVGRVTAPVVKRKPMSTGGAVSGSSQVQRRNLALARLTAVLAKERHSGFLPSLYIHGTQGLSHTAISPRQPGIPLAFSSGDFLCYLPTIRRRSVVSHGPDVTVMTRKGAFLSRVAMIVPSSPKSKSTSSAFAARCASVVGHAMM